MIVKLEGICLIFTSTRITNFEDEDPSLPDEIEQLIEDGDGTPTDDETEEMDGAFVRTKKVYIPKVTVDKALYLLWHTGCDGDYTETMGALTQDYGLLPAVSCSDQGDLDNWEFYVSPIFTVEGETKTLLQNEKVRRWVTDTWDKIKSYIKDTPSEDEEIETEFYLNENQLEIFPEPLN